MAIGDFKHFSSASSDADMWWNSVASSKTTVQKSIEAGVGIVKSESHNTITLSIDPAYILIKKEKDYMDRPTVAKAYDKMLEAIDRYKTEIKLVKDND